MAATIKDIARETGLSLATISKYLNGGNLREKNRAAIEAAIKKLDYHVNEYARGLKSKKSRTVGVVLPEISNLFNMKIVAVFERVLQENGYSVIVKAMFSSRGIFLPSLLTLVSPVRKARAHRAKLSPCSSGCSRKTATASL